MVHGQKEGKITNFNFEDSPSLKDLESTHDSNLPFFYLEVIAATTNNIHVNQNGVYNCREVHAFYKINLPEY